ncbi:hypothetical protein [Sphingobacterium psychroaquaticum]|uniref:Uncharacterized protein n=1 Tax=Sphingobacterium psychroaquaticum TaxID=561061 RepID=A0A1X7KD68_9SPHI|nr:hypothetical protein [Sphingobacterium psychroaquaticum]SMG39172.1 hypothetical protein SAMN05660862_2748 [Sphingobacterium psychroaquaticum]
MLRLLTFVIFLFLAPTNKAAAKISVRKCASQLHVLTDDLTVAKQQYAETTRRFEHAEASWISPIWDNDGELTKSQDYTIHKLLHSLSWKTLHGSSLFVARERYAMASPPVFPLARYLLFLQLKIPSVDTV